MDKTAHFPRLLQALTAATLVLLPAWAQAQNGFDRGKTRVSVSAGSSSAYNGNYFQLGVGAGYFIQDGLELGLDARSWLGGDLTIHEITPSVTYVYASLQGLKPYAGLLYRKTFIEDRDDRSAYGARAGLYLEQSQNLVLRAGIAAIRYQNCNTTANADCTEFYPELSAGLYF